MVLQYKALAPQISAFQERPFSEAMVGIFGLQVCRHKPSSQGLKWPASAVNAPTYKTHYSHYKGSGM
jgi:hypothetical protein